MPIRYLDHKLHSFYQSANGFISPQMGLYEDFRLLHFRLTNICNFYKQFYDLNCFRRKCTDLLSDMFISRTHTVNTFYLVNKFTLFKY